jgi:hypothetical protein
VEVQFNNSECQQLFSIFFADFLESVASELTNGRKVNCLELLEGICQDPQLDEDSAIEFLRKPVGTLAAWLSTEIKVPTWLPSIDREVELTLRRQEFIALCGNISKHNIGRLTRTAKRLAQILERASIDLPMIDTLSVLDDFYTQFHDNVFNYHGGLIAQLLNDVRWGIHEYLEPQFLRAYTPAAPDSVMYSYRYPANVSAPFAKSCFWDLMNDVRAKPYIARFSVRPFLEARY